MNPVLAARQQHKALKTTIKEQDGKIFVGASQDCTAVVEYAKAQHNAGAFGSSDLKHAARIPLVIIEKYLNDNGVSYAEFMSTPKHQRAMLNDPANKLFRIWPGRV